MNKINDAHDECSLCGDVGEVTITAWTKQNGDKRETVGCPLCIQTERDTEIAALKQRVADLESVAQAEPVVRSLLSPEDIKALRRFAECCEDSDSGGHDVSKEAMKRLELAGAVRSLGFRRHETTKFGDYVLEDAAPQPSSPPGWKLVPVEPTSKMIVAGAEADPQFFTHAQFVYRAMLAAAPEQEGGAA